MTREEINSWSLAHISGAITASVVEHRVELAAYGDTSAILAGSAACSRSQLDDRDQQ